MRFLEIFSSAEHVLKMIGLIERLAMIGTKLPENISINLILQSLPDSFENFIVNFNMSNTTVSLPELHNMLNTYESSTSKGKAILMVSSSSANPNAKGKNKQKNKKKKAFDAKSIKPKGGIRKKPKLAKDECLFCHEKGHWKKDCAKFKAHTAVGVNSGAK
ncbi:unnamed protein product [Cuscuta epithymum]|uniref:CCHC-type domain-containing protein n=1 Tax=Cuscuta epithymum TaxID=186058 RepID=A0AAV0E5H5_9ASTE|nr:unnamed protein product [Cuscuta epithymum]